MRLRLGDYVVRVDLQGAEAQQRSAPDSQAPLKFTEDDFFAPKSKSEPMHPRPPGLPDLFGQPEVGDLSESGRVDPMRDAPFTFDEAFPLPASSQGKPESPDTISRDRPDSDPIARKGPLEPGRKVDQSPEPGGPSDTVLREAFMRGLGLDAAEFSCRDPVAQMENFGREYRMMMEGLMHLLRKRAEEKHKAGIAGATLVGASEVNPLKFLRTVDSALAMLVKEHGPDFLAADAAIAEAIRDLVDHHVNTWRGVQAALRRMIGRFDPAALEEELKSRKALETLLAGGRRAKLWELYEQRHREIAKSAESRFLGTVGTDFRNAYEGKGE
jgi:type VI secretion system protein ImpI